jgi:hypothetical protein
MRRSIHAQEMFPFGIFMQIHTHTYTHTHTHTWYRHIN